MQAQQILLSWTEVLLSPFDSHFPELNWSFQNYQVYTSLCQLELTVHKYFIAYTLPKYNKVMGAY